MNKLSELIFSGRLKAGSTLIWRRKSVGVTHKAFLRADGLIETQDGLIHKTPSGAAKHLNGGKPVDGWLAWKLEDSGMTLGELRDSKEST